MISFAKAVPEGGAYQVIANHFRLSLSRALSLLCEKKCSNIIELLMPKIIFIHGIIKLCLPTSSTLGSIQKLNYISRIISTKMKLPEAGDNIIGRDGKFHEILSHENFIEIFQSGLVKT